MAADHFDAKHSLQRIPHSFGCNKRLQEQRKGKNCEKSTIETIGLLARK